MRILLIGGASGRTPALVDALSRSQHAHEIYALCPVNNLGQFLGSECAGGVHFERGHVLDYMAIAAYAKKIKPDFAIIGPEEPLAGGVADLLSKKLGIPCVSPFARPAQIESSKAFCRMLLRKWYCDRRNPEYRVFQSMDGLSDYLRQQEECVVKPDGLAGGRGVRLFPDHFRSREEAVRYGQELFLRGHRAVLVEKRVHGIEFSLQSLCDGKHIVHTPPVHDHKPVLERDGGPFGGGSGSYACENFMLPFLSQEQIFAAEAINTVVMYAIARECEEEFVGVLYGSFIVTSEGRVYVIEMNARWGDPECLNTLAILETDFIDICEAQLNKTLHLLPLQFRSCATVCKYVMPEGYPHRGVRGVPIDMSMVPAPSDSLRIYYGGVDQRDGRLYLTGSRAVAFVGVAPTLAEAEEIAEQAACAVQGPVYHRRDIGTQAWIEEKMRQSQMMRRS